MCSLQFTTVPPTPKYTTESVIYVDFPILKTFMTLITIPHLEMECGLNFFPGLMQGEVFCEKGGKDALMP